MAPNRVKKFIEQSIKDAEAQYDAFVIKLTEKIGVVNAAVLDGNHVWSESVLTVTLPTSEEQKWHTKQIINFSKLGKLFFQWPSRRLVAASKTLKRLKDENGFNVKCEVGREQQ